MVKDYENTSGSNPNFCNTRSILVRVLCNHSRVWWYLMEHAIVTVIIAAILAGVIVLIYDDKGPRGA